MAPPFVSLLKVRLLVGFLGERSQCGWWPTAYYEPSGRLFLEPVFPKTTQIVQYHGVIEAARRVHDEHLSVGSYHLFRLPEEMEQDLHALLQNPPANLSLADLSQSKPVTLYELRNMGGGAKTSVAGPVSIGKVGEIGNHIEEIAAVYHSAFTTGVHSFPYLTR